MLYSLRPYKAVEEKIEKTSNNHMSLAILPVKLPNSLEFSFLVYFPPRVCNPLKLKVISPHCCICRQQKIP